MSNQLKQFSGAVVFMVLTLIMFNAII